MVTIDELVSDIQDIGFFDFYEIMDKIHSIDPKIYDRYLYEIQRNLNRLESLTNIITRKVPIDEFFSEDPRLALQQFKLDLVKFRLDINVVKKDFRILIEDYTCYNSCKSIFDKEVLIADNVLEFKELLRFFWPSNPLSAQMSTIEHDLKYNELALGFIEKAEKDLIMELNSLRRFENLPEIKLLTEHFESLAI